MKYVYNNSLLAKGLMQYLMQNGSYNIVCNINFKVFYAI